MLLPIVTRRRATWVFDSHCCKTRVVSIELYHICTPLHRPRLACDSSQVTAIASHWCQGWWMAVAQPGAMAIHYISGTAVPRRSRWSTTFIGPLVPQLPPSANDRGIMNMRWSPPGHRSSTQTAEHRHCLLDMTVQRCPIAHEGNAVRGDQQRRGGGGGGGTMLLQWNCLGKL